MGQVPQIRYGIIGDGRMARHMAHYLELIGTPAVLWSRNFFKANSLSLEQQLADCSIILILTSDQAITPLIQEHPFLREKRILHFSGALVTPLCPGFHPLMTFGAELYDLKTYSEIPFICEANGPEFKEIFPQLPNPFFKIQPELKPLYHSLCVMSGNFTVLLWQKLFRDFPKKMGIPPEAGIPYLRKITQNIETHPHSALTGPLQRGDTQTIAANLNALEGDPFQKIYEAFVDAVKKSKEERKAL